jgi:proteasome lid subunit RPN8/RPN11
VGARHTDSRLSVPFEEDEKDPSVWFLDHNYVESMNDMFKKINAREKLIGWYHTGPKLRASDLEINELFKRYTPNPLLVIIDVQPKEVGVPTDAYFAVDEIKDVRLHQTRNTVCLKTDTDRRTEPQPQRRSSTHPQPSKPKKQKRLELSTCSVIFATSPSVLCPLV